MSKTKHHSLQGHILVCRVCGDTWTSMDPFEIEKSRGVVGSVCSPCIYIEMAARHAHQKGKSLHAAVGRYLKGTSKILGKSMKEIWRAKTETKKETI